MKKKINDNAFDITKKSRLWLDKIEKISEEDLKTELQDIELSIDVIEKIATNKEVASEIFERVFEIMGLKPEDFN